MTWQKEVSELIENVICDLFNLQRVNGFYDAEDAKFAKTIEIKAPQGTCSDPARRGPEDSFSIVRTIPNSA